jgi:HEPN domain-containing protein
MMPVMTNPNIVKRMDELIQEGKLLWQLFDKGKMVIQDPVRFTQWTTSCLNLLDKLSIATNRFVVEFEAWAKRGNGHQVNIGAALGVLMAAREEYSQGLTIDYHLSVASTVFGGMLHQAEYLFEKDYLQAAAVLGGAALEEALKARALAIPLELSGKETLVPLLHRLKDKNVRLLTEFEATNLEAVAKMRNDAAHGGPFEYTREQVEEALKKIRNTLENLLGQRC